MTVAGVIGMVAMWAGFGALYAWIKLGARAERLRAWMRGER